MGPSNHRETKSVAWRRERESRSSSSHEVFCASRLMPSHLTSLSVEKEQGEGRPAQAQSMDIFCSGQPGLTEPSVFPITYISYANLTKYHHKKTGWRRQRHPGLTGVKWIREAKAKVLEEAASTPMCLLTRPHTESSGSLGDEVAAGRE